MLSWDEKTGRQTYSKVTDTYTKKTDEIYILTLQSGEKIETTWNHSFRVMKAERTANGEQRIAGTLSAMLKPQTLQVSLYSAFGQSEEKPDAENSEWREARRLKKGDVLFDSTGRQLRIRDVQIEKRQETVYNFTVEGEHDYYVGEDGVLVHNEGCGDSIIQDNLNKIVDYMTPKGLKKWDYENSFEGMEKTKRIQQYKDLISHYNNRGNDVETLANIFEHDFPSKSESLGSRLNGVFAATETNNIPFIPYISLPIYAPGLQIGPPRIGDDGYNSDYQDFSPTQTGHFLTGLRLALDPGVLRQRPWISGVIQGKSARESLEEDNMKYKMMSDEEFAIRSVIGHEKVPDFGSASNPTTSFRPRYTLKEQIKSATDMDSLVFKQTLKMLEKQEYPRFTAEIEKNMRLIKVEPYKVIAKGTLLETSIKNKGNSYEDLRLTLISYHMASRIKLGAISNRQEAAKYIRETLGKKK